MSITEKADSAVQSCLAWLAATQDKQGSWTGALRSTYIIWYAAGLAIDGELPTSAVIVNICEYIETCICADGGFGPYPGEPSTGFDTAMSIPLLAWARRDPAIIRRAREYLRKHGEEFRDPINQFLRWMFEPECRPRIGSDRGPNRLLLHALLIISRRHPTIRWKLEKRHPRSYQQASWAIRKLSAFLVRAWTYPPAGSLEESLRVSPHNVGFDTTLFTTAAIRKLAGDTSADGERLMKFALRRRGRYDSGAYLHDWLSPLVADMFFTQSMGMGKEYAQASAALRRIHYDGNGWLRGIPISMNIFDTALTLQALHVAGVPKDEPMVRRACDFLLAARRPDGLWSWQYDRACTGHPGNSDTDDSGGACMALAQNGDVTTLDVVKNAIPALSSLQEQDGSFSTYGSGVLRPNWCCVSNTSRATQALLLAGVSGSDDRIERAVQWLRARQMPDGSWVDGWCARYIYGTTMALEALLLAGANAQDPVVQRARNWLIDLQNTDGGWGESWHGGPSPSTNEHTGLALRTLCLIDGSPRRVLESGANWLIKSQRDDGGWDASYFVDFGFGTGFGDSQLPVVWALHGLGSAMRVLGAYRETMQVA